MSKNYIELPECAKAELENYVWDKNVNHPSHYETGKFECIDVMLEIFGKNAVMQFCRCNAFKYLYRMDRKNGYEDIQKAKWYIDKYIELAEN